MDFNKRIPVIYTYFPKNSGQKKVPDNQQKIRIKCIAKKSDAGIKAGITLERIKKLMRAVERDNLIYISVVKISLHILARHYTAHGVADKDVTGS